jgi:hypothetical protein
MRIISQWFISSLLSIFCFILIFVISKFVPQKIYIVLFGNQVKRLVDQRKSHGLQKGGLETLIFHCRCF